MRGRKLLRLRSQRELKNLGGIGGLSWPPCYSETTGRVYFPNQTYGRANSAKNDSYERVWKFQESFAVKIASQERLKMLHEVWARVPRRRELRFGIEEFRTANRAHFFSLSLAFERLG